MEILNQTVVSSISESKQISECDVAEWEEMKEVKIYTIVSDQLSPPITGLQSAFRHSKESSTNGIPLLLC